MLFNATHAEETRVGIVDGQKLIDIDIETLGREQRKSNIYKGVITRIEPSLEACFVDYGEERHGFLPFKEVSRAYFKAGVEPRTATIRDALFEGQELIVQVEKEERGNKGAALTTFISLAGRYLVLMPNNPRGGGVSRRIEGEERQELREAMDQLDLPAGMSTIARTAGIGRTAEELQWDLNYLLKLWSAISEAATPQYEYRTTEKGRPVTHYVTDAVRDGKNLKRANPAPFLIVEESNLVIRAIRDYFQPDIGEILVDTDDIYDQARQFMAHVMPDMVNRVKRYRDETPLFSRFQIEHQIETAYSRTVPLPSGGAIVIDHTEALVAVDVNSARATRGADIEETALRTNLEAADEVARQMRLRDLGGLIVIDFIDMSDPKNQRQVEQRIKDAIRPDRARVQIAKISRFGLLELSRQRLRPSLSEGSHVTCPRCNGVGVIRDTESCALQVLRILQEEAAKEGTGALHAQVPVDVATYVLNEKRSEVAKIEARFKVPVVLIPNTTLETPHYYIERLRADDERLDDDVSSYKRADDLSPVADDPYALKSKEDKPARSKQVPVIKNVLPQDVAPTHEPKPEPKPESKGSFFDRILAFFGLGSSEDKDVKPAAKAETRKADRRGKQRRTRDEARSAGKRMERRQAARAEKSAEKTVERRHEDEVETQQAAQSEAAQTSERRQRRTRRPRAEAPVQTVTETTDAVQTTEVTDVSEQAPEAAKPQRQRPARRPRVREEAAAAQKSVAEEVPTAPVTPVEQDLAQAGAVELPAEAPVAAVETAPVEATELPESDAPENDEQPVVESDTRRRRPRRRRRPTRLNEAVSVTPAQETVQAVAEETAIKTVEEAAPVETESALATIEPVCGQEPQEAPVAEAAASPEPVAEAAVETVGETPAQAAAVEEAPVLAAVSVVEQPVTSAIAEGLEENLRAAGLEQVHTDPALCQPVDYSPVKYPGRPRPAVAAVEEGPLVQVHTDPKYIS